MGHKYLVFESKYSKINPKEARKGITRASKFYKGNKKMKQVELEMLIIDWIYRSKKGKETGFGEFVEILALAPESVLSTKFVRTLIEF